MKIHLNIQYLAIVIFNTMIIINKGLAKDIYSILDEEQHIADHKYLYNKSSSNNYSHNKKRSSKIFKRHIFNIEIEPKLYAKIDLGYGWFSGKVKSQNYAANNSGTFLLFNQVNNTEIIATNFPGVSYNKKSTSSFMITPAIGFQLTKNFRIDLSLSKLSDQKNTLTLFPALSTQTAATAPDSVTLKRQSWLGAFTVYYDITDRFKVIPFI